MFLVTIIVTTISWIFILRYQNYEISKFDLIFAIYTMLVQSGYPNYDHLPPRTLTIIWIIGTMILAVAFSAISFDLLTVNIYDREILTLAEATRTGDSKFCYQNIHESLFFAVEESIAKLLMQKRSHKEFSLDDCLMYATTHHHFFGLAAVRPTFYDLPRIYSDANGEPMLYSLDETFLKWDINMIMRSGFPLLKDFDLWIPRILQSGFLVKWENDFNDNTLRAIRTGTKSEVEPLGLEHMLIAFIIWIGGIILAIVVFLIEVLTFNSIFT